MILYWIGIKLYVLMVRLAAPFNEKAGFMVAGRKNVFNKLKEKISGDKDIIWFHAASLGEFEQGRPVIEEIKRKNPDSKILLTFFSPSGYEIRKNYEGADYIFYLPYDGALNAKRFIDIVKPKQAFFIKYEYWYYYLRELNRKDIPTYIFSAIYRKEQPFFKWYGGFWRKMLGFYNTIFIQNNESIELLKSIGVKNYIVAGDTRFDRVYDIASKAQHLPLIEKFVGDSDAVICGSTWPKDEDNLAEYINNSKTGHKWIIAPHETHKSHVAEILKKLDGKAILYTEATEENVINADVLIIDCIGILSSVYQYGKISYIGGGFGRGIHNTLEAATFGLSIVFGPNYHKFKEAVQLIEKGAAFTYNEYAELETILDKLTGDRDYMEERGKLSAEYVSNNIGATRTILEKC